MTELTADISNLSVKRISVNELPLVVDLFDKYRMFYKQQSDIPLAEGFLRERLLNNESVIFVALNKDVAVGFTQLYPKYSSARAVKNWILNDLYVEEEYRKMGIGRELIQVATDFSKASNAKFVQLETATDNYSAQDLYESMGFIKQPPDTDFIMYRINVDNN